MLKSLKLGWQNLDMENKQKKMGKKGKQMETTLTQLLAIIQKLRAPDGCPWDRIQTHETIRGKLMEEAYEVIDAISSGDMTHLQEELGDLLLHILLQCQMASENNHFTFENVMQGLSEKLIRRHPHVFGEENFSDSTEVSIAWDKIKEQEKLHKQKKQTQQPDELNPFKDIPKNFDPLLRSVKIGKIAASYHFDWPDKIKVHQKIFEELDELGEVIIESSETKSQKRETKSNGGMNERTHARIKEEYGDVLFTMAQLARHYSIDPADALYCANRKFSQRFIAMLESMEKMEKMEELNDTASEKTCKDKFLALNDAKKEHLWQHVKKSYSNRPKT